MARLSATLLLLQIALPLCAAVIRPGKYFTTMSPTSTTTTSTTTSSTTTQPLTDFQGIGSTDILDTTTTAPTTTISTTTASTTTESTTTASTTTASTTTASTSTTTEPTTTTTAASTTTTTETTSTATTTGSLSTDLQAEVTTTAVIGKRYRTTTADILNFTVDYDADGDYPGEDDPDYPDFSGRHPFGYKKKSFKKKYPVKDLNLVPLSFNVDFNGEPGPPQGYKKRGKNRRYPPFPGKFTTTQATTTLVTDAQGVSESDTTTSEPTTTTETTVTTTEPTTTTETTVTTTEPTTTTETTVTTTEEETTTTETTVTTTEPTTTTETTVTTTEPTTTTETTVTTTEAETTTTEGQTTTTSTESTSLVTDMQGSGTTYPPAPYAKPALVMPYGAILVAVVGPKTYPRKSAAAATKQSSYLDYCRPRTTGNQTRTSFQPRTAFTLRTQAGQEFDASGEADSYKRLVTFYSQDGDLPQSGYTQSTTALDFEDPSQAIQIVVVSQQEINACFIIDVTSCNQDYLFASSLLLNILLRRVVDVPTTVPLTYTVNKELRLQDFPPDRSNLANFCSSVDRIYRVVPSPDVAAARQVTVLNQSGAVRIYIREAGYSP